MFNIFKRNKIDITSNIIKDIRYNKKFAFYEGKAYIKHFNQTFDVSFETSIDYAEKCINSLNDNQSKKMYDDICNALINSCNEFVEDYLDDEILGPLYGLNKEQIMEHISSLEIVIEESNEEHVGYFICGNCDWDEEHGFKLAICDNQIKFVGGGMDTYNLWNN